MGNQLELAIFIFDPMILTDSVVFLRLYIFLFFFFSSLEGLFDKMRKNPKQRVQALGGAPETVAKALVCLGR